MFIVSNVSDKPQPVQVILPEGGLKTVNLAPGESGTFNIDPGQARYHRGALTAKPVPAKTRRKAKRPKA